MKLTKELLEELGKVLEDAESYKPFVRKILDTLKIFGDEIEEIPKALSGWFIKNRIESVAMYMENGFTREESIMMTLDDISQLKEITRRRYGSQSGK